MADPVAGPDETIEDDVEMVEGTAEANGDAEILASGLADDEESGDPPRVSFIDYLKSPVVQLVVGRGAARTTLSAHQDLLTKSPWFEQRCAEFASTSGPRLIELPDDDITAVGMVLEYIYNDEYFPRLVGGSGPGRRDGGVEHDPAFPTPDSTGEQLLRHARVYTLGEKFMMPALKSLAHTKIHRTTSTARGEIAYARYVYANVPVDDTSVRRPVAAFWATRSHVLRHEAEEEFRAMCLEYPQFGFDVLSMVLDQREKQRGTTADTATASGGDTTPGVKIGGRKRPRVSGV